MKTQVLLTQKDRALYLTPWKEEFRGRMPEVLKETGAEAPFFDNSLPADFPGVVVKRTLVHVAVMHDEASVKLEYHAQLEAIRVEAGLEVGSAIKPIVVTAL